MGTLEKEVGKQIRRTRIQTAVLRTIGVAGLLSVALLAPNALKVIEQFSGKKSKQHKYRISSAREHLYERGLIVYEDTAKGRMVRLTEKGSKVLDSIVFAGTPLPRPKRWDGKWRLIIFDIKEERRGTRAKIRRAFIQMGFMRLQDSVWVYPYDCEDILMLLKADFRLGKEVLYIIADKVEGDRPLKTFFGL